jgi:hypothetical protein
MGSQSAWNPSWMIETPWVNSSLRLVSCVYRYGSIRADEQLGDSSKSLHDEMRKIDSMTVTTFGNLHLEVSYIRYNRDLYRD